MTAAGYSSQLVEVRTAATAVDQRPPLDQHLLNFHRRVLQDALSEASSMYWIRRAKAFAAVGNEACDLIATNCRRHAALVDDLGINAEAQALLDIVLSEAIA